ncbi:3-dehydro-L-gulonate 2-dehydrogenase [Mucilaginibacter conchicola]|uniref:3-dehydro-L-gulonate 2-dehydrogenase n=1 Tax=Mucilaginibacter conchicola TaxID=2303333 RepID=A0A372NN67_9SPHI|nr:3-dehydro-L-gulonate 2-dehydrogenase [Mucilaginibacter conchicola]RFZ90364.1 3-dehydro-L-gulonate 2-dehydrogenase [Mucilaginibacter conchicola]
MRIPYHELANRFKQILTQIGFTEAKAAACAAIFAGNSRDGVHSHGLNRFPTFIEYVKEGLVLPDAEPSLVSTLGAIEQWDGNLGPGMLNASFCMNRAVELAAENGIGCIAVKNTNHWMRGGIYGLQAAEAGYVGICFTNTIANLPPWGGTQPRLGNNPLIIAVPRPGGHVVLDMAISQYAVGKLQKYEMDGKPLPQPGGYDNEGNLTTDAAAILESKRALPIGFWKGSGLSLVLDILATVLSGGQSTAAITQAGRKESAVSQVFIAIKTDNEKNAELIDQIISYTKSDDTGKEILFPGENMLRTREESLREGVWVDEKIWQKISAL